MASVRESHTLVDDTKKLQCASVSSQAILLSYHEVFFPSLLSSREIEASSSTLAGAASMGGTPCWSLSSVVSDGLVPSPRSSSVHLGLS